MSLKPTIGKFYTKATSSPKRRLATAVAIVLVIILIVVPVVRKFQRDNYYRNLTKELQAEEGNEPEDASSATDADYYVNDFKYAVTIMIGPKGFTPTAVSVKPNTKIIFKTTDIKPHFVMLSPGSKSPRYFGEKEDINQHRVYQTKLETMGVYGFYDKYSPTHSLTVTVIK